MGVVCNNTPNLGVFCEVFYSLSSEFHKKWPKLPHHWIGVDGV